MGLSTPSKSHNGQNFIICNSPAADGPAGVTGASAATHAYVWMVWRDVVLKIAREDNFRRPTKRRSSVSVVSSFMRHFDNLRSFCVCGDEEHDAVAAAAPANTNVRQRRWPQWRRPTNPQSIR